MKKNFGFVPLYYTRWLGSILSHLVGDVKKFSDFFRGMNGRLADLA
jgi:hypothetical protein